MSNGLVSLILPTMGRLSMAARALRTMMAGTEGLDAEAIIVVDGNDRESYDLFKSLNFPGQVVLSKERLGPIRAWNYGATLARGDIFVLGANDTIWERGWLPPALEEMAAIPDGWGVVGFACAPGFERSDDFVPHFMMHRRFAVEILGGQFLPPVYMSQCIDVEVYRRAVAAGRYRYSPRSRLTHLQVYYGTRPFDALDVWRLQYHERDHAILFERQKQGWPNTWAPALTLNPPKGI